MKKKELIIINMVLRFVSADQSVSLRHKTYIWALAVRYVCVCMCVPYLWKSNEKIKNRTTNWLYVGCMFILFLCLLLLLCCVICDVWCVCQTSIIYNIRIVYTINILIFLCASLWTSISFQSIGQTQIVLERNLRATDH